MINQLHYRHVSAVSGDAAASCTPPPPPPPTKNANVAAADFTQTTTGGAAECGCRPSPGPERTVQGGGWVTFTGPKVSKAKQLQLHLPIPGRVQTTDPRTYRCIKEEEQGMQGEESREQEAQHPQPTSQRDIHDRHVLSRQLSGQSADPALVPALLRSMALICPRGQGARANQGGRVADESRQIDDPSVCHRRAFGYQPERSSRSCAALGGNDLLQV